MIALPSLLGISLILFTVLALAPGDPFEDLALNPNVPPEVRMALRAAVRPGRPGLAALLPLAGEHAARRLGLLLRQPHRRRHADPAAPAGDDRRHRHVAAAGAAGGAAGGRAGRRAALFVVRPHRQHAGLHRLFAADLLHRRAVHPVLQHLPGLAAFRLPRRPVRNRLGMVVGAVQAKHHAGHGAGPVPGREHHALRALVGARRDPARLRDHRAQQGLERARRHQQARGAQRA